MTATATATKTITTKRLNQLTRLKMRIMEEVEAINGNRRIRILKDWEVAYDLVKTIQVGSSFSHAGTVANAYSFPAYATALLIGKSGQHIRAIATLANAKAGSTGMGRLDTAKREIENGDIGTVIGKTTRLPNSDKVAVLARLGNEQANYWLRFLPDPQVKIDQLWADFCSEYRYSESEIQSVFDILVLSDWLEAAGDPAAEQLRVACEDLV